MEKRWRQGTLDRQKQSLKMAFSSIGVAVVGVLAVFGAERLRRFPSDVDGDGTLTIKELTVFLKAPSTYACAARE